ncbi:MAG: N-methyl-L-tryptophan oxidase [Planctomycetota bacterium]
MTKLFDVIVLGVGGVGSAALFHLARRGLRVLGIDQYGVAHDRGSSHGETRAIRKAYFEHPDYVPLLERAYENWFRLEAEANIPGRLLVRQGILEIGPPEGILIRGLRHASDRYDLLLEEVEERAFRERFAGFDLPHGNVAVYEPDGGFLHVELCIRTHVEQARIQGAQLLLGQKVLTWKDAGGSVELETTDGIFLADKLVVTAGAWTTQILGQLGLPLRVLRKHLHWYEVKQGDYAGSEGSPVFFYERPSGYFYGFPCLNGESPFPSAIKVAEHSGGETLSDPHHRGNQKDLAEVVRVEQFLSDCMPAVSHKARGHTTCMYTMSPDEHFIIDCHPDTDRVVFAAGLSGHGFKFASVLGEVLADLAESGQTEMPIGFLRLDRFRTS